MSDTTKTILGVAASVLVLAGIIYLTSPKQTSPTTPAQPSVLAQENSGSSCSAKTMDGNASWQGALGALAGSIRITNTGSKACTFNSNPTLTLLSGQNIFPAPVQYSNSTPSLITIPPGSSISAKFNWSNWCKTAPAGDKRFIMTLNDGSLIVAPVKDPSGNPQTDAPRCDSASSPSSFVIDSFTLDTQPLAQ